MPPKYEYKTVMLKDPLGDLLHTSPPPLLRDAETILNNCGNDGWELVSAYCSGRYNHHYYFKRELQQEPHVTQVNETGLGFLQNYRAWKSDFENNYRESQKQREKETEGDEEQQIGKDRLEAELQRVLKVELEAENKAKLKAYSEAEADAKAQKKHYSETGEFISKGE
jgi:hypothetical protein